MSALLAFVLNHRRGVLAAWALCILLSTPLALRLPAVLQGSSEAIRGSESEQVSQIVQREFGRGSAYPAMVVVQSSVTEVQEERFALAVCDLERLLLARDEVSAVVHYWNSGTTQLLGSDHKSALVLVTPQADSLAEAENFTRTLRRQIAGAGLPEDFSLIVTGPAAMFHDMNGNSSADLMRAEIIGVPLTLLILLVVCRSIWAAALALSLAFAAVALSAAVLYLMSPWLPVTVFAQNAITIVGLGAGVDYCLFILHRYRTALLQGVSAHDALRSACKSAGAAVIVAGLSVGVGFLALFLVNARVLHSLAVGGLVVTFGAVAAATTLLPVLLHYLGGKIARSVAGTVGRSSTGTPRKWAQELAQRVIERPWHYLAPSLVLLIALAVPVLRMNPWSFGVTDLQPEFEARKGYEVLSRYFEKGWIGPVVLVLEASPDHSLRGEGARDAAATIAARLRGDSRVAHLHGFSGEFDVMNPRAMVAMLTVISRHPPESREMMDFVRELRASQRQAAADGDIRVSVGGTTASILDFDDEMFGSLTRVVPAVLTVCFLALLMFFRSIVIPLKAVAVNLLCVLAAYGLLVLVFQDGSAGGLNSFIVLMLFTILFGLSMDYEIVLLRQIQEHYRATGDNAASITRGLGQGASVITGAAAIMVCLFGSLLFTELAATRQFGLGMAFAVALDATVIRLLIVPAAMIVLGRANWWHPGGAR